MASIPWYKTGTVGVSNGGSIFTGAGTAWVANANSGQGIQGPDGQVYEIDAVTDDTHITIVGTYAGTTVGSGGAYSIMPFQGYQLQLAVQAAALVAAAGTLLNLSPSEGDVFQYLSGLWTTSTPLEILNDTFKDIAEDTVASATTCDIGAATSPKVQITGVATIASFGTVPKAIRFVRFTGALILTHNASSLILPGAANILTAAGDTALFMSDNSGNWRCYDYQVAANPPSAIATAESDISTIEASLYGAMQWAVAGGTPDAITAAYSPPVTTLTDGLICAFRATAANASATPTFKADGTAAHTMTKLGGKPLIPKNISGSLSEYFVRYNLANTRWELLNPTQAAIVLDAYLSAAQSVSNNTWAVVKFDTVVEDTIAGYSASTGKFTPTVAGKYGVFAVLQGHITTLIQDMVVSVTKNGLFGGAGVSYGFTETDAYADNTHYSNGAKVSAIVSCNGTTDFIEVDGRIIGTGGGNEFFGSATGIGARVNIVYLGE